MSEEPNPGIGRAALAAREPLKADDVPITPMIALRIYDVGICFLLVRRLESELRRPDQANDVPEATSPKPVNLLALIDGIAKAREKMRKPIKELEDACPTVENADPTGLADALKPMLEKVPCTGTK